MRRRRTHREGAIGKFLFPLSLLVIVTFFLSVSAFKTPLFFSWDGISSKVQRVTKYIDRHDRQYWTEWHQWLLDNASEEELTSLKNYPNSYIKLISHLGLIEKHPETSFEATNEAMLIGDVLYPGTVHDCVGVSPRPMGAYLYECLFDQNYSGPHPVLNGNVINALSDEERDELHAAYDKLYKRKDAYVQWRERYRE